jgi:hypothetical protein
LLPSKYRSPKELGEIPYMPISFFKRYSIKSGIWQEEKIFKSSGTTNTIEFSKHFVRDMKWYEQISTLCFNQFFGKTKDFCYLALLPHYIEKGDSSLVYMVSKLIGDSKFKASSFYLEDYGRLKETLLDCKANKTSTILFGVSYALLDFFEYSYLDFSDLIVIDTGGMKGRKKEVIKEELYNLYKTRCNAKSFCSEYGMTELMSQAYALNGIDFQLPESMILSVREVNDPFSEVKDGKAGTANIIDLANVDSCAFIATEDMAIKNADGSFKILGRIDNSDMRGCNLLVSE